MTILVWKPVTWDTHILGNLHIDISPADIPSGKHTKTMENHIFQWENSLFLWLFSVANC